MKVITALFSNVLEASGYRCIDELGYWFFMKLDKEYQDFIAHSKCGVYGSAKFFDLPISRLFLGHPRRVGREFLQPSFNAAAQFQRRIHQRRRVFSNAYPLGALEEIAGESRKSHMTPTVELSWLRGFLRSSARTPGWAMDLVRGRARGNTQKSALERRRKSWSPIFGYRPV